MDETQWIFYVVGVVVTALSVILWYVLYLALAAQFPQLAAANYGIAVLGTLVALGLVGLSIANTIK